MQTKLRGRVVKIKNNKVHLKNEKGILKTAINSTYSVLLGDIIEIENQIPRILASNRTPNRSALWSEKILSPRKLHCMGIRSKIENGIQEFFRSKDFKEIRTPLLVPCPGMEPHIRPFEVKKVNESKGRYYLPTSPEFSMKRLLVGGLEKIFQICSAFRDEPNSPTHRPEFTILEWYRAYANYEDIMVDVEKLFEFLAYKLFHQPVIPYQGKEISVKTPWPRLEVRSLFLEKAGIDLVKSSEIHHLISHCKRFGIIVGENDHWDDLYFKIWMHQIEPSLPTQQAVFVTRYPPSQAALAKIDKDPDGSSWARRFEVYAAGLELGNAFDELTDPDEQRKRFIEDMKLREKLYGESFPTTPIDEDFLVALTEGMPPSGGIAMGVDRIVMLFANETDIQYTFWI